MAEKQIQKSQRMEEFHMFVVAVIAIILVGLSFFILAGSRKIFGLEMTVFGWLIRIFIVLVAIGTVYVTRVHSRSTKYSIKDGKLIISKNFFGSKENREIIKLNRKTVSSISIQQTYIQKMYDVGTITVFIEGYGGRKSYKLENIDQPKTILSLIEDHIQ